MDTEVDKNKARHLAHERAVQEANRMYPPEKGYAIASAIQHLEAHYYAEYTKP